MRKGIHFGCCTLLLLLIGSSFAYANNYHIRAIVNGEEQEDTLILGDQDDCLFELINDQDEPYVLPEGCYVEWKLWKIQSKYNALSSYYTLSSASPERATLQVTTDIFHNESHFDGFRKWIDPETRQPYHYCMLIAEVKKGAYGKVAEYKRAIKFKILPAIPTMRVTIKDVDRTTDSQNPRYLVDIEVCCSFFDELYLSCIDDVEAQATYIRTIKDFTHTDEPPYLVQDVWLDACNGLDVIAHNIYGDSGYEHVVAYENIEEPADIQGISKESSTKVQAIYDLSGRASNGRQHGVHIMKMADGTVRKILVK